MLSLYWVVDISIPELKFGWLASVNMVPRIYVQSLVKVGSVTTEIFLIWTNAVRQVAWINVFLAVGDCLIVLEICL